MLLKGRSKEDAIQLGQHMADVITDNNPKPVKLKFEKVKYPYQFAAILITEIFFFFPDSDIWRIFFNFNCFSFWFSQKYWGILVFIFWDVLLIKLSQSMLWFSLLGENCLCTFQQGVVWFNEFSEKKRELKICWSFSKEKYFLFITHLLSIFKNLFTTLSVNLFISLQVVEISNK